MQDSIVREITLNATPERVYKAITDEKEIISWFPESVEEGTLEVGQTPIFVFNNGEHKSRIYVEAANPFTYFAYRWVPGGDGFLGDVSSVANTLVEFHIEEMPGGSKVTLRESGFAALDPEIAEGRFNDNSGGWDYMMERLEKVMS